MVTIRLCWRLARGGGRAGLTRLLLMVLGVAFGVASLAVAASLPSVVDARIHRAADRLALRADHPEQASFRYSQTDDTANDRPWLHATIAPDPRNPAPAGPVLPPGLARLPRPGETFASPALIEAARTSPGLAARLGPVAGVIGPAGLQGPDEAVSYTGVARDYLDPSNQGSFFGGSPRDVDAPASPGMLAVELALLAGGPALLFLVTCSRLSAATRARRLAALRLVGLSRRELLAVAGLEAAATGALGCALGLGLHALVAPALGSSGILGIGWYPADSAIGPVTSAVVVAGVAALSARFASLGMSRVLADATGIRRGAAPGQGSLWRLPPVLVGLTVLLVFAVSTVGHSDRIYLPETVDVVVAAMALAVLGLLLAIGPFCRLLAGVVARRTRSLAVRLGARRVQYEAGSLVRVVTGLVLLVLVAGLGQAILRSAALAAGAEAQTQSLQVQLDEATPEARARLVAVPALARVATLSAEVAAEPATPQGGTQPGPSQGSTGHGSTGQGGEAVASNEGGPDPRYAGMAVYYVTCSELRTMLREPVPACQDGRTYRLDDADPATAPSRVTAGMPLLVPAAGGRAATLTAPRDTLTVPSLAPALALGTDGVLVTSLRPPVGGWPERTQLTYVIGPSNEDLAGLRARVDALAPHLQPPMQSHDIGALEAFRIHRGAIDLGVLIGFLLALLTFTVAAVDRAVERRPAVASLVVLGVPSRTLRLAQVAQLALPVGGALAAAVLITFLAAHDYLVVDDPRLGPSLQPLAWALAMAGAALLTALASAMPVPGLRPRTEELRRE